jgi:hypothetical protein
VARSLGTAACETCPAGSFAAVTKDRCGDCDPGQYVNGSICVNCEIGRYAPTAMNGGCLECAGGFYTNNVTLQATACIDCGPGEYSPAGSVLCSTCGVGTWSGSRSPTCTNCSAGTYSNVVLATSCTNCLSGKYSNEGATACTECPVGKKSGARAAVCENCATGKYTNSTGTLFCTACDAGRASTTTGSSSCDICVPGRYQSETRSPICNDCPAGQYQTDYEAPACIECSVGQYQPNTGTLNCTDCPVGKVMAAEGQAACDDCEAGRYQAAEGKSSCNLCDPGYWAYEGETECDICDVGYWYQDYANRHAGSTTAGCVKCPENSNCGGDLCLPVTKVNYWSDRTTNNPDDASIIYRCPTAACIGSNAGYNGSEMGCSDIWRIDKYSHISSTHDRRRRSLMGLANVSIDVICVEGSTGPLCASCEPDWYMALETRTCKKCTETSILDTIYTVLGVAGVAGFLYIFMRNRGVPTPLFLIKKYHFPERIQFPLVDVIMQIDSGAMKLIYVTIQIIVSVSTNLDMSFPEPFNTLSSMLGILQLDFLSADCMEGSTFHTNVYFISSFPAFLIFLVILLYYIRKYWNMKYPDASFNLQEVYDDHFKTFLLITFMFLPPVAMTQFRGLNCIYYKHNNDAYLKADSSIDCNSKAHQQFVIINAFLILIYQSIPIGYIILLVKNRNLLNPKTNLDDDNEKLRLRDSDVSISYFKFLFQDVRRAMWFHEIIDIYRRLIIISILPLVSSNILVRAYFGSFISFLSTIYFREAGPYRVGFTNLLGTIAQYQILIVFLAALLLEGSTLNLFGLNEVFVGMLLFLINFIILSGAFFVGYWRNKQELKALEMKLLKVVKIEDGADYSKETYAVTMDMIIETQMPSSEILVFYYTSFAGAKIMTRFGIPTFNDIFLESDGDEDSRHGIVFSLRGPHQMPENDPSLKIMNKYASSYEVVLCVAMPRSLLWPLPSSKSSSSSSGQNNNNVIGGGFVNHNDESLVILPYDSLTAFRRNLTKQEKKISLKGWEMDAKTLRLKNEEEKKLNDTTNGIVIIPNDPPITISNSNIKKAYRLKKEEDCKTRSIKVDDIYLPTLKKAKQTFMHHMSFEMNNNENKYKSLKVYKCSDYLSAMFDIRKKCEERGLVPLYHYTTSNVEKFILKEGFRMATSHGNDGGVYFSTLGPASNGIGTYVYEKNVITNCFGEDEVKRKLGKNMIDCCIVYGAESRVLRQAPGGIEHSKMFSKNYFETLAEPTLETNDYFLRPDRILGSFIIDPYEDSYDDMNDVHDEMVEEIEMDLRDKQAIDSIQISAQENVSQFNKYLIKTNNNSSNVDVKKKNISSSSLNNKKTDPLDNLEEGSTGSGGSGGGGNDKESLIKTTTPNRPKHVPRGKNSKKQVLTKSNDVEVI